MIDDDRAVAVANYRTRLEAEVAAGFLQNADIPFVIQSAEGMLHGPLGAGATVLVRAEHAAYARGILLGDDAPDPAAPGAVAVGRYLSAADAEEARALLDAAGIPSLIREIRSQRAIDVFVRRTHADRARRVLAAKTEDSA